MIQSIKIENFKRFDHLLINLDVDQSNSMIITGPHGSGKTQLLWALMFFFRGLQLTGEPSRYMGSELPLLLNRSELKNIQDFTSFFHDQNMTECTFTASLREEKEEDNSQDNKIVVKFHMGGALSCHCPLLTTPCYNIEFAYMGSSYHFQSQESCVFTTTLMTSSSSSIRQRYFLLTSESKAFITESLQSLFGIMAIEENVRCGEIYILQSCTNKLIEVMFAGSALQKVLCTLVLLCTLSEKCNNNDSRTDGLPARFFLVEEPEVSLQKPIALRFVELLQQYATRHCIFLICTTNDNDVVAMFNQTCSNHHILSLSS